MTDAERHAMILRRVARHAIDDAGPAQRLAQEVPNMENTRAAYCACVFAQRALLRASEVETDHDIETDMIERSMIFAEAAAALLARLVRFPDWDPA